MVELQEAIALHYPDLTAHEQMVGRFIVENPTKVALLSMRKLAQAAAVTPYSVIRFFKKFNFQKFDDIKNLASQGLAIDPLAVLERTRDDLVQKKTKESGGILSTQLNLILTAIKTPTADELDRLAETLMRAKVNYVAGFRTSQALAQHFHYCAQHAHKNILFVSGVSSYSIDQLAQIGPSDVMFALSFKPYTQIIIRLCQYAKNRGAKLVVMTDSKLSPLYRLADESVFVAADGPSYFNSMVGPTIILERLLTRMHVLNEQTAYERLKSHRALHRFLDKSS